MNSDYLNALFVRLRQTELEAQLERSAWLQQFPAPQHKQRGMLVTLFSMISVKR